MSSNHTPGPLYAIPNEVGIAWHVCTRKDDDDRQPDYKRTAVTTDSENARADAELYAAAPDLLAELLKLKALRDRWRSDDRYSSLDYMDAIDALPWEAAIAKAEGR